MKKTSTSRPRKAKAKAETVEPKKVNPFYVYADELLRVVESKDNGGMNRVLNNLNDAATRLRLGKKV